jgi:hypothetical protein
VKAASATTIVPLGGHSGTFFAIENEPPRAKDEQNPWCCSAMFFPGYDAAMGLTLLSGRFIADEDMRGAGVKFRRGQ